MSAPDPEASVEDYLHDMLSELEEQTEILRDMRNTLDRIDQRGREHDAR